MLAHRGSITNWYEYSLNAGVNTIESQLLHSGSLEQPKCRR